MENTRRTILAAAGMGLGACATTRPAAASANVDALIERSRASNAALMKGDIVTYRQIVTYTDDFTLMSPFGGEPTHGRDMTPERWEAMGRFFRNGAFDQTIVQTYETADMIVLALIERCSAEVAGLPHQEWRLRVTLVYRRDGGEWRLAHRHADPLVDGVTHVTSAALARGAIK